MNICIDCSAIMSQESFHEILASSLSFPSWYGNNLDSLHDCLTSLSGTVRLENWEIAEERLGKYGHAAKKVLLHSALENEALILIL